MLRYYIRAKVILAVLSLAYCSIAMLFLGYRHALALGLMAGLLEFIPVAGWITALTIIATVGLITHAHWIWMAALLGLWRGNNGAPCFPPPLRHHIGDSPPFALLPTNSSGAVPGRV